MVVEDEADIRLFPVRRRMWQRIGEQTRLVAAASEREADDLPSH
ncbi:MAG: hypothetical protein WCF57_24550 [Pyrinomonadaceae bacterium]